MVKASKMKLRRGPHIQLNVIGTRPLSHNGQPQQASLAAYKSDESLTAKQNASGLSMHLTINVARETNLNFNYLVLSDSSFAFCIFLYFPDATP